MNEPATNKPESRSWPRDEFAQSEIVMWIWNFCPILIAVIAGLALMAFPRSRSGMAVAYCAQDQVFAEPIFGEFEKSAGVRVRAVFDSEAVKTVGLANRLLAERNSPQCDVFWGNEEMRTRQLAGRGVWRKAHGWAAFGYRSRRIVVNTNLLLVTRAPHSLLELTNETWRGKVALAYPQFGTTATHFHALRQLWGAEAWEHWCRGLAANKPFVVEGNSAVVDLVGKGIALIGLTDSDDIAAGQEKKYPLTAMPMSAETLLIPNTVAVTDNTPHPSSAQRLFDYLQTRQVLERLVAIKALEGASMDEAPVPGLKVDWPALLRDLDSVTARLGEIFLR